MKKILYAALFLVYNLNLAMDVQTNIQLVIDGITLLHIFPQEKDLESYVSRTLNEAYKGNIGGLFEILYSNCEPLYDKLVAHLPDITWVNRLYSHVNNKLDYIDLLKSIMERPIKKDSLLVLNALVGIGQGYSHALKAAVKGAKSKSWCVRDYALSLFITLIKKEIDCYQEAINIASDTLLDPFNCSNAYYLFKTLLEHNQGYKEALKTAQDGMKNNYHEVRRWALYLRELVDENKNNINKNLLLNKLGRNH